MAISVQFFLQECSAPLKLRLLAGEKGTDREIAASRAQEAGLSITGELPPPAGRVQILGWCRDQASAEDIRKFRNQTSPAAPRG